MQFLSQPEFLCELGDPKEVGGLGPKKHLETIESACLQKLFTLWWHATLFVLPELQKNWSLHALQTIHELARSSVADVVLISRQILDQGPMTIKVRVSLSLTQTALRPF